MVYSSGWIPSLEKKFTHWFFSTIYDGSETIFEAIVLESQYFLPRFLSHLKNLISMSFSLKPLSDPNFIRVQCFYHSDMMFWSLLIELRCLTPVTAQGQGVTQGFDGCLSVPETKVTRKGQNGHFLDISGPKLAQASIWLAWAKKFLQP